MHYKNFFCLIYTHTFLINKIKLRLIKQKKMLFSRMDMTVVSISFLCLASVKVWKRKSSKCTLIFPLIIWGIKTLSNNRWKFAGAFASPYINFLYLNKRNLYNHLLGQSWQGKSHWNSRFWCSNESWLTVCIVIRCVESDIQFILFC